MNLGGQNIFYCLLCEPLQSMQTALPFEAYLLVTVIINQFKLLV